MSILSAGETREFARLPLGLVGMLALAIAAESFSERRGREVMTTAATNYRLVGESARTDAASAEILCFGDSLAKFGLVPRMLTAATGLSAYNLALIGGQPAASDAALKRVLDAGARPKAIVVDFKPSILTVASQFNVRNLPELLTFGDCVELAWRSADSEFGAQLALGWLSPTYRRRLDLRVDIRAGFSGREVAVRGELLPLWRNWEVNRGALLLNQVPGMPPAQLGPGDEQVYLPDRWIVDRVSVRYVRALLSRAEDLDIPVFWVLPPIRPDIQARRDELGLDARYDEFARRALDRYPNVTVVDGRRSGFRADLFVDLAHLEARGAAIFSAEVGAVIARRLGTDLPPIGGEQGDRWVALPPFRDRLIEEPLEHIRGSRIALGLETPDGSQRR